MCVEYVLYVHSLLNWSACDWSVHMTSEHILPNCLFAADDDLLGHITNLLHVCGLCDHQPPSSYSDVVMRFYHVVVVVVVVVVLQLSELEHSSHNRPQEHFSSYHKADG